jgi:hypothetical protein
MRIEKLLLKIDKLLYKSEKTFLRDYDLDTALTHLDAVRKVLIKNSKLIEKEDIIK